MDRADSTHHPGTREARREDCALRGWVAPEIPCARARDLSTSITSFVRGRRAERPLPSSVAERAFQAPFDGAQPPGQGRRIARSLKRGRITYYLPPELVDAVNEEAMERGRGVTRGRAFKPSAAAEEALRAHFAGKPKRGRSRAQ